MKIKIFSEKILVEHWRWSVVVLLGAAVLILWSLLANLACLFALHLFLERNGFETNVTFYYLTMFAAFVSNIYYLFPFFLFKKDRRTEEERAKYYRMM